MTNTRIWIVHKDVTNGTASVIAMFWCRLIAPDAPALTERQESGFAVLEEVDSRS